MGNRQSQDRGTNECGDHSTTSTEEGECLEASEVLDYIDEASRSEDDDVVYLGRERHQEEDDDVEWIGTRHADGTWEFPEEAK
jgi:hypothetical protein